MIDNLIEILQLNNPFLIIMAGLMIGLIHAFEPDHISAVSTQLLIKNKNGSKKLALNAKKIGVNYIAFGVFFKSSTKKTKYKAKLQILRWAKKKISMPIVAIGGINSSNYKKILYSRANFIACSNSIWNNKKLSPVSAIKEFE